jgi:hypothetical protein
LRNGAVILLVFELKQDEHLCFGGLAKKEHKSFYTVAYLFSLNPNLFTLFFYAPLHKDKV